MKIIRLAAGQLSFNRTPKELGPVAVAMLAALLHQAVDTSHSISLYGNDKANGMDEAARVMAHVLASCAGSGSTSNGGMVFRSMAGGVKSSGGKVRSSGSGVKSMTLAPFIVGKFSFMVGLVALVG